MHIVLECSQRLVDWSDSLVTGEAYPLTQALEQYSSSEPAVHSGLFLNALISCAPWGGLLAVVGVAEAGAAAAVEQSKYTYGVWSAFIVSPWLNLWTPPKLNCIVLSATWPSPVFVRIIEVAMDLIHWNFHLSPDCSSYPFLSTLAQILCCSATCSSLNKVHGAVTLSSTWRKKKHSNSVPHIPRPWVRVLAPALI